VLWWIFIFIFGSLRSTGLAVSTLNMLPVVFLYVYTSTIDSLVAMQRRCPMPPGFFSKSSCAVPSFVLGMSMLIYSRVLTAILDSERKNSVICWWEDNSNSWSLRYLFVAMFDLLTELDSDSSRVNLCALSYCGMHPFSLEIVSVLISHFMGSL
jgi:hypothetical protein